MGADFRPNPGWKCRTRGPQFPAALAVEGHPTGLSGPVPMGFVDRLRTGTGCAGAADLVRGVRLGGGALHPGHRLAPGIGRALPGLPVDILATDVDADLLARAHQACYPWSALKDLPPPWRDATFRPRRRTKPHTSLKLFR